MYTLTRQFSLCMFFHISIPALALNFEFKSVWISFSLIIFHLIVYLYFLKRQPKIIIIRIIIIIIKGIDFPSKKEKKKKDLSLKKLYCITVLSPFNGFHEQDL